MVWEPEVDEIERRKQLSYQMGGEERVAEQHARGKLTIRERIDSLVDADSFRERGVLGGSAQYEGAELIEFRPKGSVFGLAQVDGRPVALTGEDFTARPATGGAGVERTGGRRASGAEDMARELKIPMIRLIDGFGADIRAVAAMNRTYIPAMSWASTGEMMSEVPLVAVALGSVAGGPAALVAASHFAVMVRGMSQVFAAGPPVVERALGQRVDKEELGGYQVHARGSGVVDNEADSEEDALRQVRRFLSYLPGNAWETPPVETPSDPPDRQEEELLSIVPRERMRPYDVRKLVALVVDQSSSFEMGRYYGGAQITMFARLAGRPIGVLANDPLVHGGAMDAPAAQKFEKFIDLCDTFNLPIVNFADQPGFMIGSHAEAAGTLKQGVRAASAVQAAVIPWATVVVRRLYGVAGAAHQNHDRFNFRVAWPSAEWGSLPIEGGVAAAYRREIEDADDSMAHRADLEASLVNVRSPFRTAEAMDIEDLIDPRSTRAMLCEWLELAYRRLPALTGPKRRGMRP